MTPKQRRDRLFKASRPNVRPLDFSNPTDMGVLWLAYQQNSFDMEEGLNKEQFINAMLDIAEYYDFGWMIEDATQAFSEGKAPVGVMMAKSDGWELEPHYENFAWSSARNRLRAVAAFLQMMRYDKDVGVVNVYSLKKDKRFFKHIAKNYGLLNYLGCIPHGDYRGDRHIFYVRGRKHEQRSQKCR